MEFLNKLLSKIEKHPIRTLCVVILGFIIPVVSVQAAYTFPSIIPNFTSLLSAGDLLGFYAAFIATAGTVFLGFVAVKQNQIIAENQEKFQRKLLTQKREIIKPIILLEEIAFQYPYEDTEGYIAIYLENTFRNDARNVGIRNPILRHKGKNIILDFGNYRDVKASEPIQFLCSKKLLQAKETYDLRFVVDFSDIESLPYCYFVTASAENGLWRIIENTEAEVISTYDLDNIEDS